ncbi:MAG: GGDEF domain-containing protein [Planctomycetales bacterium]|nr:GGDEF domain-containing protein [Planctomycetales bacterium]
MDTPQHTSLLIGSPQGIFTDSPVGLRMCGTIFEGITAAQHGGFDTIYAVFSGLPEPPEQALEALHSVCPRARITILVQMHDEPAALELMQRCSWSVGVLDYLICPQSGQSLLPAGIVPPSPPGGLFERDKNRRIRELETLVMQDDLTGLKNRRYLRHFLPTILQKAGQSHCQVTLLLFDLDDFKHYNDTYGHAVGDEVLRQTAKLICRCCRGHDVVARLGGDEFVVVFWDTASVKVQCQPAAGQDRRKICQSHPREAVFMAERLRKEISAAAFDQLGPHGKGALTISGGLASFPQDAKTAEELLEKADSAMLEAKRSGKNKVLLVGKSG